MAYKLRCINSWCMHKRRGFCSKDDIECTDREKDPGKPDWIGQAPDITGKETNDNKDKKTA